MIDGALCHGSRPSAVTPSLLSTVDRIGRVVCGGVVRTESGHPAETDEGIA